MTYGWGWVPYVPVAEHRRKAKREMEKLRKKGHPVAPVEIEGRIIAATFWGKAWCENLESYRDYENRLPRGRSYVRNGFVVDLQISPLKITALVSGSSSIYKVAIAIKALPPRRWQSICQDCAGGIDSLVELLQGRFSKNVMERLCRQDKGLFPKPSEIEFSCSCPDSAYMCKHVAAALYGVGARLDQKPELLFRLRAADENDLLAGIDQALPISARTPPSGKILENEDVSALFGLDMAEGAYGNDVGGAVLSARSKRNTTERNVVHRKKSAQNKELERNGDSTKRHPTLVRKDDAEKQLWQTFEQSPGLELYRKLKSAAGRTNTDAVRDRALAMLRKIIGQPERQPIAQWASRVELYLQLTMTEGLYTEAWKTVRTHGCGDELLKSLAEASEKSHPAEALKAYAYLVEQNISFGGQANYTAACRMIERMGRIGKPAEHATFVANLIKHNKSKRNFVKLLQKR